MNRTEYPSVPCLLSFLVNTVALLSEFFRTGREELIRNKHLRN